MYKLYIPPEKLIFLGGGVYNGIVHNKIGDFMRKIRRKREKRKKRIIIISVFLFLIIMTSGYAAFSTNITLHAKGNIKEKSRVIQSWTSVSQTDFHSDYYKQNIVSATFMDNNNVPDSAVESWNVSEDKENGEVMAWVVPTASDNSKYDLYIGAKAGVIANENSRNLFDSFYNIKSIVFNDNFDTSNATTMQSMFRRCVNLIELDLSSFDTSNVTDMVGMFQSDDADNSMKIQRIILGENFNTSKVTNMRAMFGNCYSLVDVDVSGFDTRNVTNMRDMFASCFALPKVDVSNFDTSKVTNMQGMFYRCRSLTELDISNFDTSNVTNMRSMFSELNFDKLDLCSFDTRKVVDMNGIFSGTNLQSIYVGPNWTTENADITHMFYNSSVSSVTTGQC